MELVQHLAQERFLEELRKLGYLQLKMKEQRFLLKRFNNFTNDTANGVLIHNHMPLVNFIKQMLNENSFIISTHFWFGGLKNHFKKNPFILFSHNFESDLISVKNFEQDFISFYKANEVTGCSFFEKIYCCSNKDLEKFKKISKKSK